MPNLNPSGLNNINNIFNETLKEIEFGSVLDFISKFCICEPGKELIQASLPYDDIYQLRREHELIEEMKTLLISDETIPLESVTDIRKIIYKSLVQNSVLNPAELLASLDLLRLSRQIKQYFQNREGNYPYLESIAYVLAENKLLEKHISDAVSDEAEIRDNASRELLRIRNEIGEKSNRLRGRLQKIVKRFSEDELIREDFFSIREGRFVLPVKSEHKRHLSGIIHGVSQTGATVFVEPTEIIEMNNDLSLLKNEEAREIHRILLNLTDELRETAKHLLESVDLIAHLDAVFAKAKYALDFGGIKPIISDDPEIYMKEIRHPLLVHSKGIINVVPLSIEFSSEKRGFLISGPNAGGKTVAMKSIGLNITMALSGIFPLGECRTDFRTVYSAVGDHQSIENDLSTFSSQMLQVKKIIDICDKNSLVLIDELGSGTDPQEGAALASAILDSFIEMNLFFIATTHQSSLKTYALTKEVIENASLEFNEEKLIPTYKFLSGIPGNSYAFFLAKSIGLPAHIIKNSKNYLGDKQKELEQSISVLQKFRLEAVNTRAKAEAEKSKAVNQRKHYEERISELKLKKKEIIDKAKLEALEVLDNANALVENTIREIREEKKQLSEIKADYTKTKKDLEKQVSKISQESDINSKSPEELFENDSIALLDSPATIGVVMFADNDNKTAHVEVNGLKFRVSFNQLIKKEGAKKPKRDFSDHIKFDIKSRIDIRGMRAEEALRHIEDFLSDAILNNLDLVTIIHGKGTGALRASLHDYFRYHPQIESYRLGELVEGGSGVTIVKLVD